jgi:nitrate reductase alpha subunit
MLTLSRGGPIVWMSEVDAKKSWTSGIMTGSRSLTRMGPLWLGRSSRNVINEGMMLMYHAQEKLTTYPGE